MEGKGVIGGWRVKGAGINCQGCKKPPQKNRGGDQGESQVGFRTLAGGQVLFSGVSAVQDVDA